MEIEREMGEGSGKRGEREGSCCKRQAGNRVNAAQKFLKFSTRQSDRTEHNLRR